jgi:hypothetical protein
MTDNLKILFKSKYLKSGAGYSETVIKIKIKISETLQDESFICD